MPRQARIDAPGAIHHIIARGIEGRTIFEDDQDRNDFISRLGDLVSETHTRCYGWALIPNHFHLLLRTGSVPVATVMRRLLTGYAIKFNRRHQRSGHLFQNRYKSILCQQDIYLKELARYIHLNPLRAGIVKNLVELERYPFSGHSYVLGRQENSWQSTSELLSFFGDSQTEARRRYRAYLIEGCNLGRQPALVGGGLIRSAGGWSAVAAMRKAGIFQKSDERILGDSDFVESVLSQAQEAVNTRSMLMVNGVGFNDLLSAVATLLFIHPEDLKGPSKDRAVVKGRALCCYWAVRELGLPASQVAQRLMIAASTVSAALKNGARIARDKDLKLSDLLNMKI